MMTSIEPVSNEVTKARNGLSTTCFVCFPKSERIIISRAALYRVLGVERIWIEITGDILSAQGGWIDDFFKGDSEHGP
jgi:hypothetical protein